MRKQIKEIIEELSYYNKEELELMLYLVNKELSVIHEQQDIKIAMTQSVKGLNFYELFTRVVFISLGIFMIYIFITILYGGI